MADYGNVDWRARHGCHLQLEGPHPPDSFRSDGCTHAPDHFRSADLYPACRYHDWAYGCGKTEHDRWQADAALYRNIAACCRAAGISWLTSQFIAGVYFRRVRLWGRPRFAYDPPARPLLLIEWWLLFWVRYADSLVLLYRSLRAK